MFLDFGRHHNSRGEKKTFKLLYLSLRGSKTQEVRERQYLGVRGITIQEVRERKLYLRGIPFQEVSESEYLRGSSPHVHPTPIPCCGLSAHVPSDESARNEEDNQHIYI